MFKVKSDEADESRQMHVSRLNDHTGRLAVMHRGTGNIIPIPPKYPVGKYVLLLILWMAHPTSITTSVLEQFSPSTAARLTADP